MIAVIDTSSLLSLVRYYLPFDDAGSLFSHLKYEFASGRLVIIDAVHEEAKFVSKGLILQELQFLNDKNFLKTNGLPIKTDSIIPTKPKKFYNLVDNNFRTSLSFRLTEPEFEARKKDFLASADGRLMLYILNLQSINKDEEIFLVTEETSADNDKKAFKKLPSICDILKIKVCTLPELIRQYSDIAVAINGSSD